MINYQEDIILNMKPEEIRNITNLLQGVVIRSDIDYGRLYVSIIGTAGSVTCLKYDEGSLADFEAGLERVAPRDVEYAHDAREKDGNGRAHVLSAFLGPDISLPVDNGHLRLGRFQQVVGINHDVRERARTLVVTLLGNCRELSHGKHCKA